MYFIQNRAKNRKIVLDVLPAGNNEFSTRIKILKAEIQLYKVIGGATRKKFGARNPKFANN